MSSLPSWVDRSVGGWRYGVGEYKTTLSAVLTQKVQVQKLLSSTPSGQKVLTFILNHSAPQDFKIAGIDPGVVYYCWAWPPSGGQRRIAGEWTVFHGGRAARDTYFSQIFEPVMLAGPNDLARVKHIEIARQAPVLLTPANIEAEMAKVDAALKKMKTSPTQTISTGPQKTAATWPWLVAGGLLFLAFR